MWEVIWSTSNCSITHDSKEFAKWGFAVVNFMNHIYAKNPKGPSRGNIPSWLYVTHEFLRSFVWFRVKLRVTSWCIHLVNPVPHDSGFLFKSSSVFIFLFKIEKFSYKEKCGQESEVVVKWKEVSLIPHPWAALPSCTHTSQSYLAQLLLSTAAFLYYQDVNKHTF